MELTMKTLAQIQIATKLDEIGVNSIEAGSAITSEGERESIKEITQQGFKSEILSFSRPLTVDIDYCLELVSIYRIYNEYLIRAGIQWDFLNHVSVIVSGCIVYFTAD